MSILGDLYKQAKQDKMFITIKNTVINLNIVESVRYKYLLMQDKTGRGFIDPGYAHILVIERIEGYKPIILYYENKEEAISDLEIISRYLDSC